MCGQKTTKDQGGGHRKLVFGPDEALVDHPLGSSTQARAISIICEPCRVADRTARRKGGGYCSVEARDWEGEQGEEAEDRPPPASRTPESNLKRFLDVFFTLSEHLRQSLRSRAVVVEACGGEVSYGEPNLTGTPTCTTAMRGPGGFRSAQDLNGV